MARQLVSLRDCERLSAALAAACMTAVTFCLGDAIAGQYPFGWRTRDVNDLGNQFVPFDAHLWDLLHGRAEGGWLLNWQSGYGSSFLPDYGTYLSSPFAPLVMLFPRDRIDLAVYVITVLKLASAAAAMACLLAALRPGPRWAAVLLGMSYALCGWTLMLASYNPMWLDGLIAFPLLCMVGEWARRGRRPVLGVAVVAGCWAANFYIAYMATIGAGLVLVARLLTDDDASTGVRNRFTVVGRAVLTAVLGIGLTAPVLLTIVKGTQLAYPGRRTVFRPMPWADLLMRLLPGTYGFSSPSTYVDTAALLLVFVLPFHSAVPRRTRWVWTVLAVAVAASFQWRPTHLMWHVFATPNGSAYRQTFLLSGMLVIAGWLVVSHGLPTLRQLTCGTAVMVAVVGVAATGAPASLAGPGTYPLLGVGLVASAGALLTLRRNADTASSGDSARRGLAASLAIGVLIVTQVGETALSNAWIDRKRLAAMDDYPVWGKRQDWQRATIAAVDAWPDRRTDPGREQTVGNDPMAVGGEGAQYYSSLTADVYTRTMLALGGGWTSRGRNLQSLDNPVTDVIFSVAARLHSPPDPHSSHVRQSGPPAVVKQAVPPLATVRATSPAGAYGRSPYRNQEILLGARVYTPGRIIALSDGYGMPIRQTTNGVYRTPGYADDGRHSTYDIRTSCPAGTDVYFWAPSFMGNVRILGGNPVAYRGGLPSRRAPMQRLGPAPADGALTLRLRAHPGAASVEAGGVGCLSTVKLAAAERRIAADAAVEVHVSAHGISARLPVGARGYAVLGVPAVKGWSCSAGAGPSQAGGSYLGLLSVPLGRGADRVSCAFTPPGLHAGEAIGAGSLVGVAMLIGCRWWRSRRRRGARGDGPSDAAEPSPSCTVEDATIT